MARASKVSPTRAALVYRQLVTEILTGQLQTGQRLDEVEISRRLDVSRTPVREALFKLGSIGLVAISPRHGAKVVAGTMDPLWQVIDNVEKLLVRELAGRQVALAPSGRGWLWPQMHQASNNPVLRRIIDTLWQPLTIILTEQEGMIPDLSADPHIPAAEMDLCQAIQMGDVVAAEGRLHLLLNDVLERVSSRLRRF